MSRKQTEEIAIKRAISLLKTFKCRYYVIAPDGTNYGDPSLVLKRKKGEKYGHGNLKKHVEKYLEDIALGQVKTVQIENFDMKSIRSAICSFMHLKYGTGTYNSFMNPDKKSVDVVLLEPA